MLSGIFSCKIPMCLSISDLLPLLSPVRFPVSFVPPSVSEQIASSHPPDKIKVIFMDKICAFKNMLQPWDCQGKSEAMPCAAVSSAVSSTIIGNILLKMDEIIVFYLYPMYYRYHQEKDQLRGEAYKSKVRHLCNP